jgi:uncharacterized phage protein gp47/JayE
MIQIPTIQEIRDQILNDIETATGQTTPLLPKAVFRILATAQAGVLHLLYRFGAWAYNQIFTSTMDESSLALRGQELGIIRKAATKWIGSVTVSGSGATIPVDTLFQKDGIAFRSTDELIFTTTGTLLLESVESGDKNNLSIGDVITIVSPIVGVDSNAIVYAVTQSAEDQENFEDYRNRILIRQQGLPQGGAIADFVLWATEVPGIAEAIVERTTPGNLAVYPLTDNPDPINRIPEASKLTEIETYMTDPVRCPIRVSAITVNAPTELEFDVDISNLLPNNTSMQNTIEAAIREHLFSRRPKQYTNQTEESDVISQIIISRVIAEAGAISATVDLKNSLLTSISSYVLQKSEVAKLRTVTWV